MLTALLGPQRLRPIIGEVLERLELRTPAVLINAGWLEREAEDEEIREGAGVEVVNLRLWARSTELRRDPELAALTEERWHRVDQLRRLYRMRLDHTLSAAKELLREPGEAEIVLPERQSAIDSVRALDVHFARRLPELRADEAAGWHAHAAVAEHREELLEAIGEAGVVLMAGGHVVELIDRLRIFDLAEALARKPVVAWSAGAMALTERVVGFHDRPPQGAGNAEIVDVGLGRCPSLVLLPHARRRLDLQDTYRVAMMARRFAPADCLALDEGVWLWSDGADWESPSGVPLLEPSGSLTDRDTVEPAA